MNVEEFLKRHPKPWHQGWGKWGEAEICDSRGGLIGLGGLLEYVSDLEIALDKTTAGKPKEVPFGEFPSMEAVSNCGINCQTKKITFDMYNTARCHRCGRHRSFYDKKV